MPPFKSPRPPKWGGKRKKNREHFCDSLLLLCDFTWLATMAYQADQDTNIPTCQLLLAVWFWRINSSVGNKAPFGTLLVLAWLHRVVHTKRRNNCAENKFISWLHSSFENNTQHWKVSLSGRESSIFVQPAKIEHKTCRICFTGTRITFLSCGKQKLPNCMKTNPQTEQNCPPEVRSVPFSVKHFEYSTIFKEGKTENLVQTSCVVPQFMHQKLSGMIRK